MADKQVVKRAKYKSSVKDPGVAGVLKMRIYMFVFVPNDLTSKTKLNVEFRTIKGHKFTKEGSSKLALRNLTQDKGGSFIFEFDSFADRDVCKDFVATAIAYHSEGGRPISEKPDVQVRNEQLSRAETERRIKLLYIELQALHKDFVFGGILADDEFWATRKKLLDQNENKKPKQRLALKNEMWSVKPLSDGQMSWEIQGLLLRPLSGQNRLNCLMKQAIGI